jgi:hypothetical protein
MEGNFTVRCILHVKHPLCDLINKYIYYTRTVVVNFFLYFFVAKL